MNKAKSLSRLERRIFERSVVPVELRPVYDYLEHNLDEDEEWLSNRKRDLSEPIERSAKEQEELDILIESGMRAAGFHQKEIDEAMIALDESAEKDALSDEITEFEKRVSEWERQLENLLDVKYSEVRKFLLRTRKDRVAMMKLLTNGVPVPLPPAVKERHLAEIGQLRRMADALKKYKSST